MNNTIGPRSFQDGFCYDFRSSNISYRLKNVSDVKRFLFPHPNSPTEPAADLDMGLFLSQRSLTLCFLVSLKGVIRLSNGLGYIDTDLTLGSIIQSFLFLKFLHPRFQRQGCGSGSRCHRYLLTPFFLSLHKELNPR